MPEEPGSGKSRLGEGLEEETDVRIMLLSWLQSEIVVVRNLIERIHSENNGRPSAMPADRHPRYCWICGNQVDSETCNIDEYGMAVHGDCYFVKVTASDSLGCPFHTLR